MFLNSGPKVAASPKVEPELISLFVAIAMSGGCFILAFCNNAPSYLKLQ